jgi:hypothetical protein
MGAKCFPLVLRQPNLVACHKDDFGRKKSSRQRISLSGGLVCRSQAANRG